MVHFIIPLRSRITTKDWESVSLLLKGTVEGILNQTCENYSVTIVGDEEPEVKLSNHSRLQFLKHNLPSPEKQFSDDGRNLYLRNRRQKLCYGVHHVQPEMEDYIFPVDADDRISSKLVEFLDEAPSRPCWYLASGIKVHYKLRRFIPINDLVQQTSSSCILRAKECGIPTEAKPASYSNCYWFLGNHKTFLMDMAEKKIEPKAIPFCAGAYILGSNLNLSNKYRDTFARRLKFIAPFFIKGKMYRSRQEDEFGPLVSLKKKT